MTPAEKRDTLVSALVHYSSRWAAGERMSRVQAEEWIVDVERETVAAAVARLWTLSGSVLLTDPLLRQEVNQVLELLPQDNFQPVVWNTRSDRATDIISEALQASGDLRQWCRMLAEQILNDAGRYEST